MAKTETNPLIHCDSCGEDYSATYRRCPFCGNKEHKSRATDEEYVFEGGYIFDELDREKSGSGKAKGDASAANHGGKRLAGGAPAAARPASGAPRNNAVPQGRSAASKHRAPRSRFEEILADLGLTELTPVKIAALALTLVVIIAALVILLKLVSPGKDKPDTPDVKDPVPSQSEPAEESPSTEPSKDPVVEDPKPTSTIPADQTAVNFTIESRFKEFTISDKYPDPVKIKFNLLPAGSKGTITWTSSDPAIATVDQNGTVTAVSKGTVTITATLPGADPQTCKVRSAITAPAAPSTNPAPSPSASTSTPTDPTGNLKLNLDEFSITSKYPKPVTLKVTGAEGTVTWTSSNSSVATVDQNGKVTQVGNGKCTITATDASGNSDSCLVYCSGK